jgi:hypothetical protein
MGNKSSCCRNKIKENIIEEEEEGMTINPIYNMTFEETFFEEAEANAVVQNANAVVQNANEVVQNANAVVQNANEVVQNASACETVAAEKKDRPKLNRKSKSELNDEYYNHSKDALQDLDNYLFGF